MRKLVCGILFLGGCGISTTLPPSTDEFYHRLTLKPTVTEKDNGAQKVETVINPFDIAIVAEVDCDDELIKRKYTIDGGDTKSFSITSNIIHDCSISSWTTK